MDVGLVLSGRDAAVAPTGFDAGAALDAGEAVLRLRLGGICATDLELCRGYMGFQGVLGHEFVAQVEAAPDPAWVGRRVVGEINCPCGTCPRCLAGRGNHCAARTVLGIDGRDGAFASRFALPLNNLVAVPDGVSDDAAVFVEPLAAALRILDQVHIGPSQRVVVLGLGRLGQLCARVLALTGAQVFGVARRQASLDRLPVGIVPVLGDDLDAALGGRTADVVVDTTGTPDGLAMAAGAVRPRGTVVLKTTTHDLGQTSPAQWVIDEVTVVGSRCGPFAPALRLLQSGAVDPRPLISARVPLDQAARGLDLAAQRDNLKVVIEP